MLEASGRPVAVRSIDHAGRRRDLQRRVLRWRAMALAMNAAAAGVSRRRHGQIAAGVSAG